MFNIGDLVVYGSEGVCEVSDISKRKFGNEDREYYILNSVTDTKSIVYVPVGNEKLESKMHNVLSSKEIYEIISSIPTQKGIWIDNDLLRKEKYNEIIKNGRHLELISLIKAVQNKQESLRDSGKKLHQSDVKFLSEAQKMLHGEFSVVLNIEMDEVGPFIKERISSM